MIGRLLDRLGAWIWPVAILALVASHGVAFRTAWSWRGDREAARQAAAVARQQDAIFRAAESLSRVEYDLRLRNDALSARAQEHEDAARADPDPCRLPATGSLQRLRTRWAAD